MKKYKMIDFAMKLNGVKVRSQKRMVEKVEKESVRKVREFLMKEDNSRQMPGKSDTVKNDKKEKVQNLHWLTSFKICFSNSRQKTQI